MTITGIKLINNKIIKNSKGDILKYLNKNDKYFKKFGEIYFSKIKKNKKKGWTKHKKNQCLISCLFGKVNFELLDLRKKSSTYLCRQKILLDSNQNKILVIPKQIAFCFSSKQNSLIVNTLELPHQDSEVEKF